MTTSSNDVVDCAWEDRVGEPSADTVLSLLIALLVMLP